MDSFTVCSVLCLHGCYDESANPHSYRTKGIPDISSIQWNCGVWIERCLAHHGKPLLSEILVKRQFDKKNVAFFKLINSTQINNSRFFLDIYGQVFAICAAYASMIVLGYWHEPTYYKIYTGAFLTAFTVTQFCLFKRTQQFFEETLHPIK